jgi:hypothetical protein
MSSKTMDSKLSQASRLGDPQFEEPKQPRNSGEVLKFKVREREFADHIILFGH